MFSHFNLKLNNDYSYFVTNYYSKGLELLSDNKAKLEKSLDEYIDETGSIAAEALQGDWFTQIPVDVFISHSHMDEKIAISIAGWLYKEFNLTTFVDSCLWGYADDLLAKINDKYNIKKIEDDGTTTYFHKKANYAASHVHMMLCTSLNKMIDNCESVFFLNTENSIISSQYSEKTKSPWIYFEICLANTIEKHLPERYPIKHADVRAFYESAGKDLSVKYPLYLKDFIGLTKQDLLKWASDKNETEHPLDTLYCIVKSR